MDGWLLIAQGAAATLVLTKSSLFAPLREHGPAGWQKFAGCPLCVGVWVGAFFSVSKQFLLMGWPQTRPDWMEMAIWAVGNGAAAGASALLYMSAVGCLDALAEAAEKSASSPAAMRLPPPPRAPFISESPTDPTFGAEEIPTGPAGYQDKTRPVSTSAIAAAERAIAKKNE